MNTDQRPTEPPERRKRTLTLVIEGPDAPAIAVGVLKGLKVVAAGIMDRHKDTVATVTMDVHD